MRKRLVRFLQYKHGSQNILDIFLRIQLQFFLDIFVNNENAKHVKLTCFVSFSLHLFIS